MSNTNTGGPAFPFVCDADFDYGTGMTLRDYFAAKAMQGFVMDDLVCRDAETEFDWYKNIAEAAYKTADAMLKERNK